MKKCSVRVLTIDPGLTNTGWAVMDYDANSGDVVVVALGSIHPGPTADRAEYRGDVDKFTKRTITLRLLRASLTEIMTHTRPDYVVVEDIFFNPQRPMAHAALAMWHCLTRLCCLDVLQKNMEIIQTKIAKQAITGSGGNGKVTVQKSILLAKDISFKPPSLEKAMDEHQADAIAVGYAFVKRNRERILQEKGFIKFS